MVYPARRILRAVGSVLSAVCPYQFKVWILLVLCVLVAFPVIVWKFSSTGFSVHYQGGPLICQQPSNFLAAWFYGGIFVLLTLPVSLYEVAMHLAYYTRPDLQKFVIRISWMVPFYSLDAWLSLRFFHAHMYVDPLRECYEAFVIYSFYSYLVAYLTSKVGDLNAHVERKPQLHHIWGFQLFYRTWPMGRDYIWQCKKGILNYVIVRPILAALGMMGEAWGFYNVGSVAGVWFWIFLINNFSQIWAIYCLIMFYRATKDDLSSIRPVSKFLLIKSVVFLTFWQSIAISAVFSLNLVKTEKWTTYETEDVSAGVQDFFICVEMFFAALLFAYAFPPKDYMDEDDPGSGFLKNVVNMFDVRDVVEDVSTHFEDGMTRSKEQVVNVTSGVVHHVGKILTTPAKLTKKWRKENETKKLTEEEASLSLLRSSLQSTSVQSTSSTARELSTTIESEMTVSESQHIRMGGSRLDEDNVLLEDDADGSQQTRLESFEMESIREHKGPTSDG